MDQRQLASVLFAALGVFIVASRLPEIFILAATLIPVVSNKDPAAPVSQHLMSILGLVSSLAAILIGFGLVQFRDRLATRLFPPATEPLSTQEVQAVAFSVLGCYVAVQGVSQLAWARQFDWSGATEVVLGVGLFFGARGLSRLWSLGRSRGFQT